MQRSSALKVPIPGRNGFRLSVRLMFKQRHMSQTLMHLPVDLTGVRPAKHADWTGKAGSRAALQEGSTPPLGASAAGKGGEEKTCRRPHDRYGGDGRPVIFLQLAERRPDRPKSKATQERALSGE